MNKKVKVRVGQKVVKQRRNKVAIMLQLLQTVNDIPEISKTDLYYSLKLSYALYKRYIEELIKEGLVPNFNCNI